MEVSLLGGGFRRAIATAHNPAKRRLRLHSRCFSATPSRKLQREEVQAAPPITFNGDAHQFVPRAQIIGSETSTPSGVSNANQRPRRGGADRQPPSQSLLRRIRVIPASPSYFTATPQYIDDLLHLSSLLRKHLLLPVSAPGQAPRVAWKTLDEYRTELAEPVRAKGHSQLIGILKRLNQIHPSLLPVEVEQAMLRYKRNIQPSLNQPKPIEIDRFGRARGLGRRKSSNAAVWVVEGDGQCLVNGKSLTEYFSKMHDRESAVFALKATQRMDKYNVFAVAQGGGTTGQAEAITLGLAKALLAHEPDLKPALRRAGCITRDPRRVERKKPGKLKARKGPAWVKR